MYRLIPLSVIVFIAIGAFLSSCESEVTPTPCDTCDVPCDTCDTTDTPCDTCDTTKPTPNPNDTTSHDFTWTEYTIPDEINLTGACVFNDNLIYVMGNKLWRWNGIKWEREKVLIYQTQREGAFADDKFFGLSPIDMWMVGGLAYHYYDGSADEYRSDPVYRGAIACWGTSSNDMFFAGYNGAIYHFDGTNFSKFPQVTTKNLYNIWGTSHNDVWACGANTSTGETTLLHYDGNSWKEDSLAFSESARKSGLFDVWAYDSSGHTFVATSGSNVYRKTDNGKWRSDTSLISNSLGGGSFVGLYLLKGNNANDLFAAGGWGWVGHWNGKTWTRYSELYDYSKLTYFSGALSVKGNTVCVVGSKDGTSWIAIGRRKP